MQLLQTLSAFSVLLGSAYSAPLSTVGRTSPPNGCLTVGKSGKYSTFGAAVAALNGNAAACIFVYPGTYPEQVTVKYGGPLTIYGYTTDVSSYSANTVSIESSVNAQTAGSDAKSSALQLTSSDVKVYNINVKNTYGQGHQAIALTVTGNQASFYGCGFFGYQDTLYAKSGQQYYKNCYIEGAVDYIFGSAAAWFSECTLVSVGYGAITANNRASTSDTTWYVIDSSKVCSSRKSRRLTTHTWNFTERHGRSWRKQASTSSDRSSSADHGVLNPGSSTRTLRSRTSSTPRDGLPWWQARLRK